MIKLDSYYSVGRTTVQRLFLCSALIFLSDSGSLPYQSQSPPPFNLLSTTPLVDMFEVLNSSFD